MTEEQLKEQLSRTFVEAIARRGGYIIGRGEIDIGVDLSVLKTKYEVVNNRKMYYTPGERIDVQLKSTTTKYLAIKNGIIKYDLEVKNYNGLIRRFNTKHQEDKTPPLILILFVLPRDNSKWLVVTNKYLKIRKCAYWYYPTVIQPISTNKRTVRIEIPTQNRVDLTTFPMLFNEIY